MRSSRSLLRVLILSVLGSALVAGCLGYVVGSDDHLYNFTTNQNRFIDGLVWGTRYRADFEDWQLTSDKIPGDARQEPEQRCAGRFFPEDPTGMSGCLQALKDRPPEGYKLPDV